MVRSRWALVGLVLLGVGQDPSRSEDFHILLAQFQGGYNLNSSRTVAIDTEVRLRRIDSVRMEWAGQVTAGFGWENGVECPGQYIVVPAAFSVYLRDDSLAFGSTPRFGKTTYPAPEHFNTSTQLHFWFGAGWDFLFDGECECQVLFWLNSFGFCSLELFQWPWGYLGSAELIIVGVRRHDADEDGDVDLRDFAAFQSCFTGNGNALTSGECAVADADGDTDADLDDVGSLVSAMNGPRP